MDVKLWINRLESWLTLFSAREGETVCVSRDQMLKEAHQELLQAQNLFSRVDDPDMIDYAVYTMKAAEERYDYLIKSMKIDGRNRDSFLKNM